MLAAPCPKCAKPVPLSLAKPDSLVCACGFSGAPTSETIRELHEASSVLGTFDARHRQLTPGQRRSLATASLRAGVTIAFVVLFVFGVAELYRRPAPAGAAAGLGVALVAVVVLRTRALRRNLAAAFGGTRCRVCGEPIAGTDPVARCHHCAADNLRGASAPDGGGSLVDRVSASARLPGGRAQ